MKWKPSPEPAIGALALHVPSFTQSDPELEFAIVELEFENYRITGDVYRFRWVSGFYPTYVTLQVEDVTVPSRKYKRLKEAFKNRTAHNEVQRIRQCLRGSL